MFGLCSIRGEKVYLLDSLECSFMGGGEEFQTLKQWALVRIGEGVKLMTSFYVLSLM
jgi:hypothetical protein